MTGGLLGERLRSAGTFVRLKGGETPLTRQLTADVPSNMQLDLHLLLLLELLEVLQLWKCTQTHRGGDSGDASECVRVVFTPRAPQPQIIYSFGKLVRLNAQQTICNVCKRAFMLCKTLTRSWGDTSISWLVNYVIIITISIIDCRIFRTIRRNINEPVYFHT